MKTGRTENTAAERESARVIKEKPRYVVEDFNEETQKHAGMQCKLEKLYELPDAGVHVHGDS